MTDPGSTTYESMVSILSALWLDYRDTEAFEALFEYADLAFPLAFALEHGIVDTTERVEAIVREAYALLLDTVGVDDSGFDVLEDVLAASTMGD